MTVDWFLPNAIIVGAIFVGGTLIYAIIYGLHLKIIGKLGVWSMWPLLAFYTACGVIGFTCAALEWNGYFYQYGFYGDSDNAQRIGSFALLGVLSILSLLSARHAASTATSTKAKG